MDTDFWTKLFGGFRPEDQKSLVVSIVGSFQVAVQNIIRIEDGLVMLRGRVAGQAEEGRLFLIPYDRISAILVNRAVQPLEAELFSPTVSDERKKEVVRMLEELVKKDREEAESAEQAATGRAGQKEVPADLKMQLETLRATAGFAGSEPAAAPIPAPAPTAVPAPSRTPGQQQPAKPSDSAPSKPALPSPPGQSRPILPPKFELPKKPGSK